jgi:hypothetical protein
MGKESSTIKVFLMLTAIFREKWLIAILLAMANALLMMARFI